jgi:phosphatidylglycerol:prolipoprotein diacylglycerol transferase
VFPVLIDLGTYDLPLFGETHLFLPTYGTLFALAVVIAWWWFMRRSRTLGSPEETLFNLTFFTLLAGIIGAKLLLILVDWRTYLGQPRLILGTLRAAGVLMGGVLAGAFVFVAYARHHGLPLRRLGDAIAAPLVLAQAIGRLGCLSAGCCWGVAAHEHSRFAITFTDPRGNLRPDRLGVPLVPVQLIEMFYDLVLVVLLTWLWRRRVRPAGTVFWCYVLLYSVGRGVIEFWRGDDFRGLYFGEAISTSQIIAIGGVVLSVMMLLRGLLHHRQTASA